jgi:hypothetical protein
MSKYLGTWKSDCGYNLIGTNQGKYQTNTFAFTSVSGSTVFGTLLTQLYSDTLCSVPISGSVSVPTDITLTYQSNAAVTSSTPPTMDGSADQLSLAVYGASAQSYTVGFYASYSKFYQGSGTLFNSASLSYSKL